MNLGEQFRGGQTLIIYMSVVVIRVARSIKTPGTRKSMYILSTRTVKI